MDRSAKPRISFLAFFLLWAQRMGWDVPPLHVRACVWLQAFWMSTSKLGVLMLPRGHAKSTILEIFNAWLYYCDPLLRLLHQSESNGTALKTSRGTQNVLRNHPLTRDIYEDTGKIEQWWINAAAQANDARNASMYAKGILSNVTSARADFIQNDDVEVPNNIGTDEAREKLRFRLGEQIHIAVPGAPKLYIGTPHTHDSLYEDVKRLGADALVVRMFELEHRIEKADKARYILPFEPEYIFTGIGEGARLLQLGVDYRMQGKTLVLTAPGGELLDCYAEAAWPERFNGAEMEERRQECRTLNEWDSQYQLHAKPVTQVRLDPERIVPYDVAALFRDANNEAALWLGSERIIGAAARWDPSGGKLKSDVSALAVALQDAMGRRYLHHLSALTGDVAEFADDGQKIIGGQVFQIADVVERLQLPRLVIETNGIGGFAPAVLRAMFKQRRIRCAVVEEPSTVNKNKRILGTFEPLLLSRAQLWAHVDVLNGPLWDQMRDWNPAITDQADDYLDAAAGAIADTPERIKGKVGKPRQGDPQDWRPEAGVHEVQFER